MRESLRDMGRAAKVAVVVGPCLVAINHFDELAWGRWSPALGLKASLTLLVPFLVSLHGASAARRQERAFPARRGARGPNQKEMR